MTQADMAETIGVTGSYLSSLEHGGSNWTSKVLLAIEKIVDDPVLYADFTRIVEEYEPMTIVGLDSHDKATVKALVESLKRNKVR
jgi:transcriptional regulator with XRE-family HTH domain